MDPEPEKTEQEQPQEAPDATGGGKQPETEPEGATPTTAKPQAPERSFSQADVDRIIAERLARQKAQIEGQFSDYEALKAAKEKLDALEEAQLSELEKAQRRAAEAEAARDRALQEANERLIQSAFMAAAAKAGAAYPEDVYYLADLSGVSIEENGTVTGVTEAVGALVEAGRLVMAGKPKAPSLDSGAGSGERPEEKTLRLTEEELAMARKLGLKPEDYAKYK